MSMGDLVDKQFNSMPYLAETQPSDYMVMIGFDKTYIEKVVMEKRGKIDDVPDEFIDKYAKNISSLHFKVQASSLQEAIARVEQTTNYMLYVDGIAKGFSLFLRLYKDLDNGKAPQEVMDRLGSDVGIDEMERVTEIIANLTMTNIQMYEDVAESNHSGAEALAKLSKPEIVSVIAFKEGHHTSMFSMSDNEMENLQDKIQQAIDNDTEKEGE